MLAAGMTVALLVGIILGRWYTRHDKQWTIAMRELEREIARDRLCEAREMSNVSRRNGRT